MQAARRRHTKTGKFMICNTDIGEATHRQYKQLKLGAGQANIIQVSKLKIYSIMYITNPGLT